MGKLNKKGFTLIEVLISFLVISVIVVSTIAIMPNLKFKSSEESNRFVTVMRNVEIMEKTRYNLRTTGEVVQFSYSELAGGNTSDNIFADDVFYATRYNRFDKYSHTPSVDSNLNKIINEALSDEIMREYRPKSASTSELYLVEVDTRVGQKTLKTSSLRAFIYRGGN